MNVSGKSRTGRLAIAGAAVGPEAVGLAAASVLPAKAGGTRRRSMPSSFSFSQRPTRLRASQFDSGARRQPQRLSAADVAEDAVAPGQAVLAVILVQELRLEPGHVHVGGALALARLALEAQVEHLVDAPGRSGPSRPSWPVMASRSALARPRVLSLLVAGRLVRRAHRPRRASCGTRRRRRTARRPRSRPPSAEKSNVVGTSGVT